MDGHQSPRFYHPQIPTHFPNDNSKHIDYVIAYKREVLRDERANGTGPGIAAVAGEAANETRAAEEASKRREQNQAVINRKRIRKLFLKKVEDEGFEVEKLAWIDKDVDEDWIYILLHCKLERLFKEAEKINLQMRINNVISFPLFLLFLIIQEN